MMLSSHVDFIRVWLRHGDALQAGRYPAAVAADFATLHAAVSADLCKPEKGSARLVLTPRGSDLIASAKAVGFNPAAACEPVPQEPCMACGGSGQRPLFVSTYPCDACGGKGTKPAASTSGIAGSEMAGDEVCWRTDTDTMRVGLRVAVKTADRIVHFGTIVGIDPGGGAFGLLRDDFVRLSICSSSWVPDRARLVCWHALSLKAVQQ